ncbi:DUF2771 domain-containing protein [Corynebacterium uberis]|uniref:DUF2771 domain-containing protein n=1 Tax=Corynebacterium TaxID=1716 RepID=UPI001D0AEF12|nr:MULTISPECIES: DUF2771 domain-containing protein [Corynebacterium]MCZ9308738.1 DUF2771 domain-containing protein [Corynebacterium sp. c6VSa_13]UDL72731.1 DUF2771 domain-containing protein [Corynebacterium uberis]UDL76393.1 DUF2771 domain-containing protein [Corynebacterium uberis]UDL78605.1 DUF2771 domain-containing protein [Corynebacterium uberis]UDL80885.1 DUF2771 domain-containing protein [Corynebacterium uberis]
MPSTRPLSRRARGRRSLLQILALIIAVVIVVVAGYLFQTWWNSRPGAEPADVRVTATVGDHSQDIAPYKVCEPGTSCPDGDVPTVRVGADEHLTLTIPREIHDHNWQLLTIYDDPAANDEQRFGPHEQTEVTVAGSAEPVAQGSTHRPRLTVVEVSAPMIGHNDNGEETPYVAVWSILTNPDPATSAAPHTPAPRP